MQTKTGPSVLNIIYIAIFLSIGVLNFMAYYVVGSYTMKIPTDSRSLLFFSIGFFMLVLSLFVAKIFTSIKDDTQTLNLLKWAIIESVVTLGFVHSFMDKENILMFYTVPSLFMMFKYRPEFSRGTIHE